MSAEIMIVLGSSSDLPVTEKGAALLKELGVPFDLRICSAHRTPEMLHEIVEAFEKDGGKTYICVAGMSAHLAGVVASLSVKPVLAVPVYRPETAGLDSLLSMGQMPAGIPVATLGLGKHGFTNAALTAVQMLALGNSDLTAKLKSHRSQQASKVSKDDEQNSIRFEG